MDAQSNRDKRPLIHFEGVSKRFSYSLERKKTLLESIIGAFSRNPDQRAELLAVNDVSFQVFPGECLGIIGRNGSGKSTILKLISGIIEPTSGFIEVNGRLSALLELGAGFHEDLTGRENIFLNGSILGMSKEEIEACYQDIVAFSELHKFIDMPVKHYSSGMYMRLGFSVAVHVAPKVLLVDEVLAVGDQNFQDKCIDRIFELKRSGVTIIIVSHSLDVIRRLASHLVWLDEGIIKATGPVEEVTGQYLEYLHKDERMALPSASEGHFRRWGTGDIEITKVRLLNASNEEADQFQVGDELTVEISYQAHKEIEEPEFGLAIYRQDGLQVNGPNNRIGGCEIKSVGGPGVVRYHIKALPLLPDTYRVTAAVHDARKPRAYDFHEQAYAFKVADAKFDLRPGVIELEAAWEWSELDKTPE